MSTLYPFFFCQASIKKHKNYLNICNWFFMRVSFCVHLQRMRDSAFSKSRSSTFEFISEHILCSCHVFYRRLWWFCAGYMAFTTLHGDYDLCGAYRSTNTGKSEVFATHSMFSLLLSFSMFYVFMVVFLLVFINFIFQLNRHFHKIFHLHYDSRVLFSTLFKSVYISKLK